VRAQLPEPPVIEFLHGNSFREATVRASWIDPETLQESDIDEQFYYDSGPWTGNASLNPPGSFALAAQNGAVSSFVIYGEGSAYSSASTYTVDFGGIIDEHVGISDAVVEFRVDFSVPVDAVFQLSANFSFDGSVSGNDTGVGSVSIIGVTDDDCPFPVHWVGPEDPDSWNFSCQGTVPADQVARLAVRVQTDSLSQVAGDSLGTFEFSFDLGDRDRDGLVDVWEKEGIDVDGDGQPEIDLPGMGANPDKKDLFVEVDVMNNVNFDQDAVDDVIRAFADAPAAMVDNPDGSKGIQLHVVRDGDRPPHQPIILDSGDIPPEYYTIKDSFFGSEDDRNHPDWDDIRRAKLLIYRYCLWADTAAFPPPDSGHVFGIAEAIPANDFIVAAGRIMTRYQDIPTAKLSATFMHELGHTLGLRHGGQNNENRKPNYLSVMNYAYSVPFRITTAQGTNVADHWRLDYSRKAMRPVNETALFETPGLNGPAGRTVRFNIAAEDDEEPLKRGLHWATGSYIDWNFEDPRNEGPYPQDLTRNSEDDDPHYDSTLESYTDWDRLWYHLVGTSDFEDREPWPFASPAEGLYEATIEAFNNVEWIDATVLDELIFENGFELGSTTAWSDTVP
jgi:hypothetical protein